MLRVKAELTQTVLPSVFKFTESAGNWGITEKIQHKTKDL